MTDTWKPPGYNSVSPYGPGGNTWWFGTQVDGDDNS